MKSKRIALLAASALAFVATGLLAHDEAQIFYALYLAGTQQQSDQTYAAWVALAQGKGEEAFSQMRQAADLEDRNEKHIMTPGRILPARELLGDLLMEMKQYLSAK